MKIDSRFVSSRSAQLLLVISTLAAPSFANDWYVDCVNGSDGNAGTSPASAWRTITHALAVAPAAPTGGTQVLHVASGLYDTALGETFPIILRDAFQLIGDQGSDLTIIDSGGASAVLQAYSLPQGMGSHLGPLSLVQGLTLQNAATGIDLASIAGSLYLTVSSTRITGMSVYGFYTHAGCQPGFCGSVFTTLAGVEITGCLVGMNVDTVDNNFPVIPSGSTSLTDCNVSGNAAAGIQCFAAGTSTQLSCTRVRVVGNGTDGLRVEDHHTLQFGTTSMQLTDCLVARNGESGVESKIVAFTGGAPHVNLGILRCTIADNVAGGIDANYPAPSPLFFPVYESTLSSSIAYGNGDDVIENPAHPTIANPAFNDVGDGDFVGNNGNISADPLFRDAAAKDYRLRWGSPCIDTGDPATPAAALDLLQVKRPVDGNLDTIEVADIGAFEFTPLWIQRGAHIGKNLVFELWGPSGGTGTLFLARNFPAATPQSTPFGDFDLNPTAFRNLGASSIAPGPPATRAVPIPNDPLYIGKTFSFQALSTSSVGSPPMAYTNPVTVTVLP